MTIKTTLMIDQEVYKAVKRVALEKDVSISSILQKGLMLYVSDPEGVEETYEVLSDSHAMKDILEGLEARRKKTRGHYLDWEKVRGL